MKYKSGKLSITDEQTNKKTKENDLRHGKVATIIIIIFNHLLINII